MKAPYNSSMRDAYFILNKCNIRLDVSSIKERVNAAAILYVFVKFKFFNHVIFNKL